MEVIEQTDLQFPFDLNLVFMQIIETSLCSCWWMARYQFWFWPFE